MVLVVASELDENARDAVRRWPNGFAVLLTPTNFCEKGWRIALNAFDDSHFVANGTTYSVGDITGVLMMLPYIMDYELFTIEEADRKYVASEIAALLLFLGSRLKCPVLNRPTPACFVGPSWRSNQWESACVRLGIAAQAVAYERRAPLMPHAEAEPLTRISVLAGKCLGDEHFLSSNVLQLAQLAKVDFLEVRLLGGGPDRVLHSIQLVPDLRDDRIERAVHNYFVS